MSTDRERPRRPNLDRREPLRNWSSMFGRTEKSADGSGSDASAGGEHGRRASLGDAISRSVDLGYRVVDEYIRQGQRAAQRLTDRNYGPDAAAGDMRETSDRMAQYASDFLGLWFEFMELTTANSGRGGVQGSEGGPARSAAAGQGSTDSAMRSPEPGGSAAPVPSESAGPPEPPNPNHARVRLEVQSVHPTEVTLDLRPDAAGRALTVHSLRASDSDKPRLIDVDLRPASDGEPARLRVRVPSEQPTGTYSGLIIDEQTSTPVGTLSVRVTRADD